MGNCLFLRKGETHTAPVSGILASTLAVGSTVKLMENGVAAEYLVVHQGLPSSMYDASCDGTWLLRKDIYENRQWHRTNVNKYESSAIHTYLNGTFLNLFDDNIKAQIKSVKLPYRKNGGYGGTTQQGANGLAAKIFLLSGPEINFTNSNMDSGEGTVLSYFSGCATTTGDSKRIAYLNGAATSWWLRSPNANDTGNTWCVSTNGACGDKFSAYSYGIRPALVLPSTALFDKTTLLFKGVA